MLTRIHHCSNDKVEVALRLKSGKSNKHLPDLEGDVEFVDGGLYVHHDLPAHHGPGFLNFNISMLSP